MSSCHVPRWCTDGAALMILRRIAILALGLLPLLPHSAFSQTQVKAHRLGLLSAGGPFTDASEVVVGLTAGFSKRGYVVGRSLLFERRAADAHPDRLPQLVDDLKSQTELMITNAYAAARVMKDRSNVPVVAITGADPVATGLIDSLARPGGKITGIGEVAAELSAKRLEVLKDAFPGLRKIAMLWNADDLGMTGRYKNAEAAARTLGFEIQPLGVREPEDFAGAFAAMERDRPDAILMVTDALTGLNRKRVFEFAAEHKLPAIYEYDFLVRDGGLMSYGPDMSEVYDRAADLADRILRGARPANLPFEQPTHFRLVINKKTLETLGLTVPAATLMRADEVVE
jgi:putative tryptophan/tyrosine transport system substrate-binding protein